MKSRLSSLFRFDTIIVILILLAFSLLWINWGKLHVYGWDLPTLYKKMTKATNTVLFFKKKDSPHLAYFIYIVPFFALLSSFFLFNLKRKIANLLLFLSCTFGLAVSLYMYYYFLSSKIFKLSNAGMGIHLLCFTGFIGIIYSLSRITSKSKPTETEFKPESTLETTGVDTSDEEMKDMEIK